jgi:hypothetical protein
METYKPLTANKLKTIAIVAMFFDHFVTVFLPHNALLSLAFRFAGRMAAPVFCFFIAEGFYYTSNLKKYIARLLIFAAISHLPYNLSFSYALSPLRATSVIWPLAIGLIALTAIKNEKPNLVFKLLILAACCAVSITANWNFVAVLWVVVFGVFHGNFKLQIIGFCVVGAVFHIMPTSLRFGFFHELYPQWFQIGIFLAIPLLAMFNGKAGKGSVAMKRLFYFFYPAHLIMLYMLKQFTPLAETLGQLL